MTDWQAEVRDFAGRFRYRAEARDRWSLLDGPGLVRGDCEDFALTVAWIVCGRSWWRFFWAVLLCRVVFWHVRLGGRGHMMLWVRGAGWIDNNYPTWSLRPKFRRWWPLWVLVWAKFLKGRT